MHDFDLYVANNQKPATIPGVGWANAPLNRVPFPSLAGVKYFQRASFMDPARGSVIYANFTVTTTFTNTAGNELRFCVLAPNSASFTDIGTVWEHVICSSRAIPSSQLVAGLQIALAIPPIKERDPNFPNAVGRLYFGLGIEYNVPTTDWVAGGVDAWFSTHVQEERPLDPVSGF